MAIKATPEKVIDIAKDEVGYLEKKSNSQLDSKTANAGRNNYTKYARDLNEIPGLLNGNKQGFAWCAVFVIWSFVKAYGVEAAKKLLCLPKNSLAASCTYAARYFKENGQFYKGNPKTGDQIFFLDGSGSVGHTGIVKNVDGRYVYTIEGNTSPSFGVIANGDGVYEKQYLLTDPKIYGYGRPDYEIDVQSDENESTVNNGVFSVEMRVLSNGDKGEDVKALQILLMGNACPCGKWGADGEFGIATENAVKQYQQKKKLQFDGIAGPETFKSLLGVK